MSTVADRERRVAGRDREEGEKGENDWLDFGLTRGQLKKERASENLLQRCILGSAHTSQSHNAAYFILNYSVREQPSLSIYIYENFNILIYNLKRKEINSNLLNLQSNLPNYK